VNTRRGLPVIAMAMLAVVVALAALTACSGSSSSTTSPSTATKTYTDKSYGYSFEYPATWKIQEQTTVDATAGNTAAGGVGVFDPKGTKVGTTYIDLMLVSVYKLNKTITDSNLGSLKSEIESVLKDLESQGTDMKREKDLSQTTAAGMKGYQVTYSFTKSGTPCMSTLYFLFDKNMEYQLTTQASEENWATDQPIFDAMIASFKP
jgi:hypothetical protein